VEILTSLKPLFLLIQMLTLLVQMLTLLISLPSGVCYAQISNDSPAAPDTSTPIDHGLNLSQTDICLTPTQRHATSPRQSEEEALELAAMDEEEDRDGIMLSGGVLAAAGEASPMKQWTATRTQWKVEQHSPLEKRSMQRRSASQNKRADVEEAADGVCGKTGGRESWSPEIGDAIKVPNKRRSDIISKNSDIISQVHLASPLAFIACACAPSRVPRRCAD
jgi:hypothetical protein